MYLNRFQSQMRIMLQDAIQSRVLYLPLHARLP